MKRRFGLICLLVLLTLSIVISLSSCDPKECSHDFTDWEITKEATCVTEGTRQRECKLCGETEVDKVAKNSSHDYGEFALVEDNNCLKTGKAVRTCKSCGDEDATYLLGDHKPGAWVGAKEPTFLEDGCVEHAVCTVCGKSIGRDLMVIANAIIPKLSSNLSVCINGEIVAPLKIEQSNSSFAKLVTAPIDVKAGDVVTICQTDNPSVKYEYTVTFNSSIPDLPVEVYGNINSDGIVRTTSSSVVSLSIGVTNTIKLSMGGYRPDSGVVAVVTHSAFDQAVMIPLEKMDYPGDPDKQAYIFGLFEAERLSVESISILDLDSGKTYGFADLDMAWNTWSFGRGSNGKIVFKDNEADWWLAFDVGGNKKIELHKLTLPASNKGTDMVFPNGDKFSLNTVTLDQDDDKYLYYTFPVLDSHLGNRSEYSKYVSGTTLDIERIEIYADAGAKFYLANSRDSSMAHENLAWVDAPEGAITVDTRNGYIEINTKGKYIIDYLPYSMSIFIYYIETTTEPDRHEHEYADGKCECGAVDPDYIPVTPDPDLEGIIIEINGIGTEMSFVTDPTEGVTSYVYGYVYINAGDKLTIRDTESGRVWGYDDIGEELSWNTWDYHRGTNGEIVFDFTARYGFEFDRAGDKKIFISKVFAPYDGESFGIDFEGEGEDIVFDGFDLSVDGDLEGEFMWILTHATTQNNSDLTEYIEEKGIWFYYTIIGFDEGEKFSLKNFTQGGLIGADNLVDITGDITAITRDGDLIKVLKSGKFHIMYLPAFNSFTIDCDTTDPLSEISIFADEELTLIPDENGDVSYNGLSVTASSCIMIFDARNSPLPIILDEAMDKSLVDLTVSGDYYYAYPTKEGTYNLRYNVYTGILYLEYLGGEEEEETVPHQIYISYDHKLSLKQSDDNPDEYYHLGITMGAWDEIKVLDSNLDYITDMTLAAGTTGIVTDGRIITFQTAGTYDFYINKTTREVRFVASSGGGDLGGDTEIDFSDGLYLSFDYDDIRIYPNEDGDVKYLGLDVTDDSVIFMKTIGYDYLPIILDESVSSSVASVYVSDGCYMLFIYKNGKANITYNVNTGIMHIEMTSVTLEGTKVTLFNDGSTTSAYSDAEGNVIFESFVLEESGSILLVDSAYEYLPMVLDPEMDTSLGSLYEYGGMTMLIINAAGTYTLKYNLSTGIVLLLSATA